MTEPAEHMSGRFSDLLEKKAPYVPVRHHQPPFWDLTRMEGGMPSHLAGVIGVAHTPGVNWAISHDPEAEVPEGTPLVEIDCNGAFVGAAGSMEFGHCALEHTGAIILPEKGQIPCGYYLMQPHPWQLGAPGSPLGPGRPALTAEGLIWVSHTVVKTLRDLTYGAGWLGSPGHWPDCKVYDSWTTDCAVRFTKWYEAIRDTRAAHKVDRDVDASERVKVGYSKAVQSWNRPPDKKGTPANERKKHNHAYRPDWYAALRSQNAMNMWRRAYQCTLAGHPPLKVSGTDRMLFTEPDLMAILGMEKGAPIRRDDTGIGLGTFKTVARWYAGIED